MTIPGSILLGLGLAFYALTHESGSKAEVETNVATLGMMGVGAPATAIGIYLLVQSRNRVTLDERWPRTMVPIALASVR